MYRFQQNSLLLLALCCLLTSMTTDVSAQLHFPELFRNFDITRNLPLIGTCDRIVYRGVGNCLTDFGPSTIGSKGMCCAYRKYRACISGLKDGLKIAVNANGCPSSTLAMSTIHGISDRVLGFTLSSCKGKKNACK